MRYSDFKEKVSLLVKRGENKEKQLSSFIDLVNEYIEDFKSKANDKDFGNCIIHDSIPVIWFGNLDNYLKSPKKIVTVGLNPSNKEFPENNRWLRFDYVDLYSSDCSRTIPLLTRSLNSYFDDDKKPYMEWFGRGEKVLHLFNASYKQNWLKNQAIHIDIYSAIATSVTWGKIDPSVRKQFEASGLPLFKKLLAILNPDIVLISTNKKAFHNVFGDFEMVYPLHKSQKKTFYFRKYQKENQTVYWIYNCRGTAFAPSFDFIRESVSESENNRSIRIDI